MASTIQAIETPKLARALDSSGNSNHGQLYSGRALEFDGVTDYFTHNGGTDLTGVNNFANGSSWTFACWIYFNSSDMILFVGKNNTNKPMLQKTSDRYLRFREEISGGPYYRFSDQKVPVNAWCRLVVTTNGTSVTAYINGVLWGTINQGDIEDAASPSITFSSTGFSFTNWGMPYYSEGNSNYGLDGMMSDSQVWDASWTQDDVTYDYLNPESLVLNRGGTSLTNSNLKIWYPMQDGHRGQQSYVLDGANTGLGNELVINGDFSNGLTSWSTQIPTGQTVEVTSSQLHVDYDHTATLGSTGVNQAILTAGKTYKTVIDVVSLTGQLRVQVGGVTHDISTTGTHTLYSTASSTTFYVIRRNNTASCEFTVDSVSVKAVNDKNHATTVFYGDMTDLFVNDESSPGSNDFGNLYNTANTKFDFTTESAAFADGGSTDNYIFPNSAFTADNIDANIVTSNTAGLHLQNNASAKGGIRSGAITTVVGRTYQLDIVHSATSESWVTSNLYIKVGTSAGDGTLVNGTNSDGGFSTTFIATTTSTHFTLGPDSTTDDDDVRIQTFQLREVGLASGWTDADQQLHIPQTALQSYNELAWSPPTKAGNLIAITPDDTDFDINTSDFTANFWVFLNSYGFTNGQYVFHKGGGGNMGWHFRIKCADNGDDGDVHFVVEDSGGDTVTNQSGANGIALGEWTMITGVVDYGTDIKLYINGELIDTDLWGDLNGDIDGGDGLEMLNWTAAYASGTLNGTATEFSIFKNTAGTAGGALSQAEINELYNDGKPLDVTSHSQATSLKGYWRNDGLNTTWKNIANPGDNDATLSNGSETILIPKGVDSSRDSQGFIMNRQRNTSSLNFSTNKIIDALGSGNRVEVENIDLSTTDFSISFWAYKFRDWNEQWIISQHTDASNRWYIRGNDSNPPELAIYARIGGNDVIGDTDSTDLDNAAYIENWMHVTVTVDRSDTSAGVTFYINGSKTSHGGVQSGQTGTSLSLTSKLTIGFNEDGSFDDHHFDGKIDGVVIYTDKLLSAAEVLRNYNATKGSHIN